MKIVLVPRPCEGFTEDAAGIEACKRAVEICGENMNGTACAIKLSYLHATYGTGNPLVTAAHVLKGEWDAGQWVKSQAFAGAQGWGKEFVSAMKEDAWGSAIVHFFGG